MEYISSPANWFLRDKNEITGLSQIGLRKIKQDNIKTLLLPSEKDGTVFEAVHDSFFRQLAKDATTIEEICFPPTMSVRILSGIYDSWPVVCSIKRLKLLNVQDLHLPYCHLCFNDELEAIDLPESSGYKTVDGVVYSADMGGVLFYPRSKKDLEFVLPAEVTYIGKYAFKNTKHLKELICSSDLTGIGERAFEDSSIGDFHTPSGTIREFVAQKDAFVGCGFALPKEVPAYTHEQASEMLLKALKSEEKDDLPSKALKYLTSLSDEIIDAFILRLKNENNRRATIDAGIMCPVMDRLPMTPKLYEAYDYIADYKNWDYRLPTEHSTIIDKCISAFIPYRLTDYKGTVQRDQAFDVGCYIFGPTPTLMMVSENITKEWLEQQIEKSIKDGKKLFITPTKIGVCCLAAEIIIELKKKYPEINLLLLKTFEYETERVGFGRWNRLEHKVTYDYKVTEDSLALKPRIETIKKEADALLWSELDWRNWVINHCTCIITTFHKKEVCKEYLDQEKEGKLEIVSYYTKDDDES